MSQERWMVSIVMWIPQSLDGVFHGKSIYKILQMDKDWGHPYFRKPPFGPKNRRFGSWKVKIQDKLWSVPCLSMGWSETVSIMALFSPNHTDNVCWNLAGYYCIVFYSIVLMLFYVVWFVVFFQAYQVMFWANNSSMMMDVPLWHWECIRFIGTGHLTWIESCKLMAQLIRNAGTYFFYVYIIYIYIFG